MFTRPYIVEYKFNNMDDVNTVFWRSIFWRRHKLIGSGQYSACNRPRSQKNGPVDIASDTQHT